MSTEALVALLVECNGNVTHAAARAGIERQSMHRLLNRHGVKPGDYRPKGATSAIAARVLRLTRHA